MTPREAFKFGFLYRCAEEGLSPAQAGARVARGLEKSAAGEDAVASLASKVLPRMGQLTGEAGKGLLGLLPIIWGISGVGGALAGHTAAKMTGSELDPDEVKRREQIEAYDMFADRALERARQHPAGLPAA